MGNAVDLVVGQWYRHPDADKGEVFQVIAIDADENTVEVQYFDGDIEELPSDAWAGVQSCAPPEDWTGPYDEIERDDLGYSDDPPLEQAGGAVENIEAGATDTDEGTAASDDLDA